MGEHIKTFSDGAFLEYDRGSFDDWCVYLTEANQSRKPPRDVDYFRQLKIFAEKYGATRIYDDYVYVYDLTKNTVDTNVLSEITNLSLTYGNDALEIDKIFSILYMAMIAEERKRFTRLGKRIKRLGIYRLLIEDRNVYEAANFMRGMKWTEIDALCRERDF